MSGYAILSLLVTTATALNIIDLSHPQSSKTTIYWPGQPSWNRTIVQKGVNEKNIWIEVGAFTSGEHGGTHIDAPRHFYNTSWDLKDLPLENVIADGVMIDCKAEAARNRDYNVTVEKLEQWEKDHGRIPDHAAVLVNFGWSAKWLSPADFFGTTQANLEDHTTFHFPIVHVEAANWLVKNRKIKMLGLDVPAPDGPRDNTFPVHIALLSRNIIILENVMIQDSLPARDFRLHAAPIRVEGGTGIQTRIYAVLYDDEFMNGARAGYSWLHLCSSVILALLSVAVCRYPTGL